MHHHPATPPSWGMRKEGRKEGSEEGSEEGREEGYESQEMQNMRCYIGRKEGRKEGMPSEPGYAEYELLQWKEGRKEGRTEVRKAGSEEGYKSQEMQNMSCEGRKEGSK